MILACASIANADYSPSRGVIFAVYVVLIVLHGACAAFLGRSMPRLQNVALVLNLGLVIATLVALPVGRVTRGGKINSGAYVFGHVENGELVGRGLGLPDAEPAYLPLGHRSLLAGESLPRQKVVSLLEPLLGDAAITKVGHGLKALSHALHRFGLPLEGKALRREIGVLGEDSLLPHPRPAQRPTLLH